ncbi:hypothetical protein CR513_16783, partial [Mucuna pruriens]
MCSHAAMKSCGLCIKVHKKNYPIHNLELAVVVFALKIWNHYLYGARFEIFSDNKNLKYLFNKEEPNISKKTNLGRISQGHNNAMPNVVVDVVSKKTTHMSTLIVKELELMEKFRDIDFHVERNDDHINCRMIMATGGF